MPGGSEAQHMLTFGFVSASQHFATRLLASAAWLLSCLSFPFVILLNFVIKTGFSCSTEDIEADSVVTHK